MKKASNLEVTHLFLAARANQARKGGYPKAKWIVYCEEMLARGYGVSLYEARQTVSKYITVTNQGRRYLVRFSNHRPNRSREANGDCDMFVGTTNFATTTYQDAIKATVAALGPCLTAPWRQP